MTHTETGMHTSKRLSPVVHISTNPMLKMVKTYTRCGNNGLEALEDIWRLTHPSLRRKVHVQRSPEGGQWRPCSLTGLTRRLVCCVLVLLGRSLLEPSARRGSGGGKLTDLRHTCCNTKGIQGGYRAVLLVIRRAKRTRTQLTWGHVSSGDESSTI